MTTKPAASARTVSPAPCTELVSWVFLKDMKSITCEVRTNEGGAFDVCVLPHWDVAKGMVEGYDTFAGAIRRHAEICLFFRSAGWALVREGRA